MSLSKRFEFSPVLGWSYTRYDLFSICKRRYYYQYYAKYDTEVPVRDIEELKALVSIPLEIGAIVHDVIKVLLNRLRTSDDEIDRARFFEFASRATQNRIRSRQFEEVYYGTVLEVRADDMLPKINQSLENLLASERYLWLVKDAGATTKAWIIDPPGYGETRLGDLKLYCKVDFVFPVGGLYHVIDWKTGKQDSDKHGKQLIGYSAWASFHFEAEPERVAPTIAYLHPSYEEIHQTFDPLDLENFATQVRAEMEEMYEYCRDVQQNIPIDKSEFPLINNEKICAVCNFRRLCFPDRYPGAKAD